jgi:hypothetical protein
MRLEHPHPDKFFHKGCDDHACQLCLVNAIKAGWGEKEV